MLQVIFVAVDIGRLSQVPHRSDADFEESCPGQDVILISSLSLSTVWSFLKNSVYFRCVCELCL